MQHRVQTRDLRFQRVDAIEEFCCSHKSDFWSSLMLVPEILSTYPPSPFLLTQAPQQRLVPSLFPFPTFCSSRFQASLYLESFSSTLTAVFLSDGTAKSMIWYFWFVSSQIMIYPAWFISRYFSLLLLLLVIFLLSLSCFTLPCTFRQCKHLLHHVADILFHPLPIPWESNSFWNDNTNCKHLKTRSEAN